MREDIKMLFNNFKEYPWPQIKCKDTNITDVTEMMFHDKFEIVLDGVNLCKTEDFVSAFQITLASYYVFNRNYPKQLEASYTFLQKEMLGIHGTVKIPAKVLTLMKRLKMKK